MTPNHSSVITSSPRVPPTPSTNPSAADPALWPHRLRDETIASLFAAQAAQTPEAVALSDGNDGIRWSYRELNFRAEILARQLRARGVGPDVVVALLAARSAAAIVGLVAVAKAGGAYLALDTDSPPERLSLILADARPAVILAQRALVDRLPADVGDTIPFLFLDDEPAAPAETAGAGPRGDALDLAYVSFTSGSSGRPKGVCIPHRGVVRLVKGTDYVEIRPDDVFLQFAPVSFDASTFEVWGALLNGARLAIFPARPASLAELGAFIEREGVTILWLTAGLFHHFVDAGQFGFLRRVRQFLAGGDVLSVPHVRAALRALPHCRLVNGYGPTENTTFTCCYPIREVPEGTTSIPIGRPIHRTYCRVLDPALRPVAPGEAGELHVGGDGLARGYLGRPELTAEKFLADPFSGEPGARLYATGDRVRELPDGNLEFLGRNDRQVKIRGFRVELDEIETVLAQCPGVKGAAVTLTQTRTGDARLTAGVTVGEGPTPDAAALRDFLRQRLPASMVPARFLILDALPLTANGKVDRHALAALADDGQDDSAAAGETPPADHASTAAALAAIWQEVLGCANQDPRENFFEAGGDSLRATHFVARIQSVLRKNVSLETMLANPTLAHLTEVLDGQPSDAAPMRFFTRRESPPPATVDNRTRAPLYCVPGQGGDLLCYAHVASYFPGEQSILGLQSRGLLGGEEGRTIEQIAAWHVAALRTYQPAGPYHLFGFCFGGLVAFEMSRQLRAAGAEVGLVAVLDFSFPASPGGANRRDPLTPWRFLQNLGLGFSDCLAMERADRVALFRRLGESLSRWGGRGGTRPEAVSGVGTRPLRLEGITADLSHYTEAQLRLLELHELAWQAYHPSPGSDPVTLLRPRRLPWRHLHDSSLGWEKVCGPELRVEVVPGPGVHGQLLRKPFAEALAGTLLRLLPDSPGSVPVAAASRA